MKYYRDSNNKIYAYEDNETPIQEGLTLIEETEVAEILNPKVDEKEQEFISLNSEITELEELIKKALIIGNNAVLESLQKEYRSLLKNKEVLSGNEAEEELVEVRPGKTADEILPTPTLPVEDNSEPITVAPTDHL